MTNGLLIVGGSYAASQIAVTARQKGYDAPIRLLSEEIDLPYQRPPLSKAFLLNPADKDTLPLRAEQVYRQQRIDVELGVRVATVDRVARSVLTADGRRLPYDKLALAVGARPRVLTIPGADLAGVHVLRNLADARQIKAALADAGDVVVIGAGFIGLEAASAAVKHGKRVTVIELQERPLGRACPPIVADWIGSLHRQRGADTRFGAQITALRGDAGRVRAVVLADGSEVAADLVIVGVGVLPNVELAQACGLACDNGIVVDQFARTSDPDIVAAGDCARFPSPHANGLIRLESVQNATDQARTAGATLVGELTPYDVVPWFWSDQYDVKMQMAGLSQGHDTHAVRGDMESGAFSVFYLSQGRIIAADSINRGADHMLARRLIAAHTLVTPQQIADPSFDLKSLLAGAAAKQ